MKTFYVTTQHDEGTSSFQTVARNQQQAIALIMAAEGCPKGAIIRIQQK